jgi:pimeloyl-ACP methyl ester carboxylesterase
MSLIAGMAALFALSILGTLSLLLMFSSRGRPAPYLDGLGHPVPGSVSEKVRLNINGFQQGMFIKGRNKAKPVLLFLHGGIPLYFLTQRHPIGLEEEFVVCWWEQRGSGLSYQPGMSPDSVSVEQLLADTIAVTNELRRRFGKDRIYLLGHSGGTFLGIQAVARAPELFHAYIGVSQIAHQLNSEREAYEYMLARCRVEHRTSLAKNLEAAPVTLEGGVPREYLRGRDRAMHALGVGTMRQMRSVMTGLFLPSLFNRDYTLKEKINLWRGKAAMGVSSMWREILATDLNERISSVSVPVYFLHGMYDYTCTHAEASAFFDHLKAPMKAFYNFKESAHSPILEEPGKFMAIMREDVLRTANGLADRT